MTRRMGVVIAAGLTAFAGGAIAVAGPSTTPKETNLKQPVVIAPLAADVVAEAMRHEQDAVLRRLDICDRLRKVGEETNNPSLVQQADELQKQVSALYAARVARLGVKAPGRESGAPGVEGASVIPATPQPTGGDR